MTANPMAPFTDRERALKAASGYPMSVGDIQGENARIVEHQFPTPEPDSVDAYNADALAQLAAQMRDARTLPKPSDMQRAPLFDHYAESRVILPVTHGVDLVDVLIVPVRAIVVHQPNPTGWVYIPEIQTFIPPGTIGATINLPEQINKISFLWYTGPTTPGGVAPVAGGYAIAWLYDDWVPPNSMMTVSSVANVGIVGTITETHPSAAATTNVANAVADTALLALNLNRKGASIYNDSASATLYVKFGAGASATSFKVAIGPGGFFELPFPIYTGAVNGFATVAVGTARISEET